MVTNIIQASNQTNSKATVINEENTDENFELEKDQVLDIKIAIPYATYERI
jgi:hypothetical protein